MSDCNFESTKKRIASTNDNLINIPARTRRKGAVLESDYSSDDVTEKERTSTINKDLQATHKTKSQRSRKDDVSNEHEIGNEKRS